MKNNILNFLLIVFFATFFVSSCQANKKNTIKAEKKLKISDFNNQIDTLFIEKFFKNQLYKSKENKEKHISLFKKVFSQKLGKKQIFKLDTFYPMVNVNKNKNKALSKLFKELSQLYLTVFDRFTKSRNIIFDKNSSEVVDFHENKKIQLRTIALIYIIGFVILDEEKIKYDKNKSHLFVTATSLNTNFAQEFYSTMKKNKFKELKEEPYNSQINITFEINNSSINVLNGDFIFEDEVFKLEKVVSKP
jgi:hypothetical protein